MANLFLPTRYCHPGTCSKGYLHYRLVSQRSTEVCQLLAICLISKGGICVLCCLYMSVSLFIYSYLIRAYYKSIQLNFWLGSKSSSFSLLLFCCCSSNEIPRPLWEIHAAINAMKAVRFHTNVFNTKQKVHRTSFAITSFLYRVFFNDLVVFQSRQNFLSTSTALSRISVHQVAFGISTTETSGHPSHHKGGNVFLDCPHHAL